MGIYQSILVRIDEGVGILPILYHVGQSYAIDLFITIIFYCH